MQNRSLEYQLKPDEQLVFLRVPKTGSTTLVLMLDAQFHSDEICPTLMPSIPKLTASQLSRYRLFRAHCDYNIDRYLGKKPAYITMLRKPLSRAISYFEFCKRDDKDAPFNKYLCEATAQGIQSFIDHPDPTIRIRTCNQQTRQIATGLGRRHSDPFAADPEEDRYSDTELLALAKAHLDECVAVGLTERFDDSLLMLCHAFGWFPALDYQRMRVAQKKTRQDDLPASVIDAILAANALDVELYAYAQTLVEQRFNQMVQELSDRYGEANLDDETTRRATLLSWVERRYAERYAERNDRPQSAIDYTFREPLSGNGWHRRSGPKSGLPSEAMPYRWTGPSTTSTLDLPLARDRDLTVRIGVINATAPDVLDSTALTVNGTAIALTPLHRKGVYALLEGQIPAPVMDSPYPFTRLSLSVNRTKAIQDAYPNYDDDRIAGIEVGGIQLFPIGTTPQDHGFRYLLFPEDDPCWNDVAKFLEQHLKPTERVVAPSEFFGRLPQSFQHHSQPFAKDSDIAWVVLHKSQLAECDRPSLRWATRHLKPVFANEVFVVLTRRPELKRLWWFSKHLRPLWKGVRSLGQK